MNFTFGIFFLHQFRSHQIGWSNFVYFFYWNFPFTMVNDTSANVSFCFCFWEKNDQIDTIVVQSVPCWIRRCIDIGFSKFWTVKPFAYIMHYTMYTIHVQYTLCMNYTYDTVLYEFLSKVFFCCYLYNFNKTRFIKDLCIKVNTVHWTVYLIRLSIDPILNPRIDGTTIYTSSSIINLFFYWKLPVFTVFLF